jgi:hypothetical protein
MNKKLVMVISVVVCVLASSTGLTQQQSDYIIVRIINDGGEALRISAYDNVCGVTLLEKVLVRNAETSAQLCTQGMDKGDVTIRNLETGAVRHYRDVLGGAKLAAPY